MTLLDRIEAREVILLDGAMGTELERRGVPMDAKAWSAAAMESHPEVVRQVHGDYVRAGAQVHIVNSFALARHVLEPAGLGAGVEAFNRRAVELAREAVGAGEAERPQWLAGSLSTFADKSDRSRLPKGERLRANYAEQAGILQAAGVELFALEMLCDLAISLEMLQAAAASGLPLMLGFTCSWGADGKSVETLAGGGDLPAQAFDAVLRQVLAVVPAGTPTIVAVMHSEFDVTGAALEVVFEQWSGPVAAYPNSGDFIYPNWQFDTVCTPAAFADAAEAWIERGVRIVGGCCGIGPAHIAALRERLG